MQKVYITYRTPEGAEFTDAMNPGTGADLLLEVGIASEIIDISPPFEWDMTKDAEEIHKWNTIAEEEAMRRGWTLVPANPKCLNCHGEGYVVASKRRGITHQEYTYRMTCRCRKAPVEKPAPKLTTEQLAWMFEED